MTILGISCYYHDSAASIIDAQGNIISAVHEERFTRKRHDPAFPTKAVQECLRAANASGESIERVVFFEHPYLKFGRIVESHREFGEVAQETFKKALPNWFGSKLNLQDSIIEQLAAATGWSGDWASKLFYSEHHMAHAASAFFPSPFEEAAVLTLDGVGEFATTSAGYGKGNDLTILREQHFPHSLGLLYSAMTYYTGFKVNSGEYKMMGLAPYGDPKYVKQIRDNLIEIAADGSYRIATDHVDGFCNERMINEKFEKIFGAPARHPDHPIREMDADLAASIQVVLEDVIFKMADSLHRETGSKNLCMAGGVALNCVSNGRLREDGPFENIWVQPAAGDAGGSLGACYHGLYAGRGGAETPARHWVKPANDNHSTALIPQDAMQGSYLGPEYSDAEIEAILEECDAEYEKLSEDALLEQAADLLADTKVVGWFNGRMEYGPRALGARSILGDPRPDHMQRTLNMKIKKREGFRPFAPAVLAEYAEEWFTTEDASPYMMFVHRLREDKRGEKPQPHSTDAQGNFALSVPKGHCDVPSITHADFSARLQTIHKETNPKFHTLIEKFRERTGCPMVVNTSFNVRGEPIVCTPEDAFRCFMNTEMDALVIGNYLLHKEEQDPLVAMRMATEFDPD